MRRVVGILLLTLASCELHYNAETRLVVEAHVQDRNGVPLPNIVVDVEAENGFDSEIIAGTRTDANGNVLLTFPEPSGSVNILINGRRFSNSINEYQNRYTNTDSTAFGNYKHTLEAVTLFRNDEITEFLIAYNDDPAISSGVSNVTVEGLIADENLDVTEIVGNSDFMPTTFTVVANSTIILRYSIVQNGTSTNYEMPFYMGAGQTEYTITY